MLCLRRKLSHASRSHRSSRFKNAMVRHSPARGVGLIVSAAVACKRVALARVTVDDGVRFTGKGRVDLSLHSLGDELIFLSQMHQNGRASSPSGKTAEEAANARSRWYFSDSVLISSTRAAPLVAAQN